MKLQLQKIVFHFLILIGFVFVALAYFSPVLQGKQIYQSDIVQYIGMSKQQKDFKAATGQETYWTNSAFGGMPTYQLGARYPHNYIKKLDSVLRFLPRPADYLFLYFLCFYILLLVLKVDFKLAALGALAFGFSTYLIIILGVGHNSKAHAIAYMPLVLSGIVLTFRKHYIYGFLLTAIAMGLELVSNHFQMTYYLMLLVVILGIVYFIDAYKKKNLPHFFKSVGVLLVAVILSIGLNATNVLATKEYVKESTRGKSALTIHPDGTPKPVTNGLDKDYITQFSYGFAETFNLFIPRFMGGGNAEKLDKDSQVYKAVRKLGATHTQALDRATHAPMYWGKQPIVEAPAYVGAAILFLFVFALFLVKGRLKWWVVSAVIFSLLLSYGKNLGFITNFFIDYVPLYNKFRAVTSIQVILELCIPVLGIFGLVKLFDPNYTSSEKLKAVIYAVSITGGLALVFVLAGTSLFDFVGVNDGRYAEALGNDFIRAVRQDRVSLFKADALRTLILVVLTAGVVLAYLKEKLKPVGAILVFAVLIIFDLVGVNRRYVNEDDFVPAIAMHKPFSANAVDKQILKDTAHFRVYDLLSGPSKPSYFHNSLNGYNAAELKRYREVFDWYVSKNQINVLSMLNAKYIIIKDEKGKIVPFVNEEANGNAWFIETLKPLPSANETIKALEDLNTKRVAVQENKADTNAKRFETDSLAQIKVVEYKPNYIKYKSQNNFDGFAVFSEIYYPHGWQAFVDGKPAEFTRVNYVLRGMALPAGTHTIEFKFDPEVVKLGSSIALASSGVLGVLILLGLFYAYKKRQESA